MLITSTLFIGAIIVAITQVLKMLSPKITGLLTVVTAVVVGIVVALLSTPLGLDHITVAQGVWTALAAVGVHVVATNAPAKTVV